MNSETAVRHGRQGCKSPGPKDSAVRQHFPRTQIRGFMIWRASLPVTTRGNVTLMAAVVMISIPFAIDIVRAQSLPPQPAYTYEVVSIHPSQPGQGRTFFRGYRTQNATAMQ